MKTKRDSEKSDFLCENHRDVKFRPFSHILQSSLSDSSANDLIGQR